MPGSLMQLMAYGGDGLPPRQAPLLLKPVYDYAEMKATRATLRFELLRYVMHPSRLGRLGLI
jgi:hypothetical protein